MWKVERYLLDFPHRPIRSSNARINKLRGYYRDYRTRYPKLKPVYCYDGRHTWTDLPPFFWSVPTD
jgi:hypothetical protein